MWIKLSVSGALLLLLACCCCCVSAAATSQIGRPCLRDRDCGQIQNGRCWRRRCVCQPFHVQLNATTCLAPSLLGFPCAKDSQCTSRVKNSVCIRGACRCSLGYTTYKRHICLAPAKINEICHTDEQCRLGTKGSTCSYIIPRVIGRCQCQNGAGLIGNKCLRPETKLGMRCELPTECGEIKNAQCTQHQDGPSTCLCAPGFTESPDLTYCRALYKEAQPLPAALGQLCVTSAECRAADPNARCELGRCQCVLPTPDCNADNYGCHNDTFQCRSSGRCISWYFVCNGVRECEDGSDELLCRPRPGRSLAHTCPRLAHRCTSGECVSLAQLCDGVSHCADGSDELGCNGPTGRVTNLIDSAKHKCPEGSFQCRSGECRPMSVFCNAVLDCADGSDEPHVSCVLGDLRATCPFRCGNNRCRSTAILCSGADGCGDASDERQCRTCKCPSFQIRARSGEPYKFYG